MGDQVYYDTHGPRFAMAGRQVEADSVVLFGVCFDGTTSYRPGARFGPDALRAASMGLESYSPVQRRDVSADIDLVDRGNLEVPAGAPAVMVEEVTRATRAILGHRARPLLLGGEHGVSLGAIRAAAELYSELMVIQIDAHADLRDGFEGQPLSHASVMKRSLDVVPRERLWQVGIRSGTRQEWRELEASGRHLEATAERLRECIDDTQGPIYLTLDLDVFDPSLMAGTGTPEPGGIDWNSFEAMLQEIPSRRLVAADVVELAPDYDPSGVSSVVAAKAVREIALKLGES